MIPIRKVEENQQSQSRLLRLLLAFPFLFLVFGLLVKSNELTWIEGMLEIFTSPGTLLTDFFEVGGIRAAFTNAALMGGLTLYLFKRFEVRIGGLSLAAFFTVLGFSFFGKNPLNIFPIFVGGVIYCRYQKIAIRDVLLVLMFSTGLSPIVSQMMFAGIFQPWIAFVLGMAIGILIGFIIVPISSHMLRFHDGFNLYNLGFTAGIIGTIFTSIMRSFQIEIEPVFLVYQTNHSVMIFFLVCLFFYLIVLGFRINPNAHRNYLRILRFPGRTVTDFPMLVGYGITFVNMGVMGLLGVVYVMLVGGVFNGPVLAAIFTVVGFSAFGKHPKNSFSVVLGVWIAAVFFGYDLQSTGMILAVLFSTTIAPIAGTYGPIAGVIAGMLHLALVTNIGGIHGGINLYNNGFSGGLVAGFFVPIIDAFKKGGR